MAYHRFGYTTVEVFHHPGPALSEDQDMPRGWYWWPCLPGCLPDGEVTGPFESEDSAMLDAKENCEGEADQFDDFVQDALS